MSAEAYGCVPERALGHGKRVEMGFKTATWNRSFTAIRSDVEQSSEAHRPPASLLLVPLFVLLLSAHSVTYGYSGSQNQMHFPPFNRDLSTSAKVLGGVPRRTLPAPSQQRRTRPSLKNSQRVTSPSSRNIVPSYSSPAIGKTGFRAATQVPAGGGLDYLWAVPAMKGDFNGDGKPDLVTLARDLTSGALPFSVSVVLSNGDGTFKPAVLTPVQSGYCFEFLVGDLNGDRKDDVVILHSADSSHPVSSVDVLISNGDGTFTAGNSYSISLSAIAGGTLADVNGDGKLDLVVVDQAAPSRVITMLGNGDGTFQAPSSSVLGGACENYLNAGNLSIADLNGDGLLDVACMGNGGELEVYLATSTSTYAAPVSYWTVDAHQNGDRMTLGDLNGDGRPDIVVPNGTDENITIYMNNGDGTFQTGFYVPVALAATPGGTVGDVAPYAVAIADVNGDGKADIISSNTRSADVTILLGNGDGTFTTPAVGYAVGGNPNTAAVVGDFDGDGIPDVVVADNEFSFVYLQGNGDGSFQAAHNYYSPIPDQGNNSFGLSIASGDFNGDGIPDFVTSNWEDSSTGITVFLSRPDGTLSPGVNYGSGGGYMSVAVADFDQDGKLDVAAVDMIAGVVRIFSGNGDGTFAMSGQFLTDSTNMVPEAVVAADFNHDGYPDLAVLNYGTFNPTLPSEANISILLNNRAGGFVLAANYPLSGKVSYPSKIVAASLQGNGHADLIVPLEYKPAVAVFSSNGDGTFQGETDIALDGVAGDIAVADLNRDGKPDLALASAIGIDVLLGNGDGTFQTPHLFVTSLQNETWDLPLTNQVSIADVDGDGLPDLVYANSEFGTVGVLFGNGDGTFSVPQESPVGGYPWGLAIADVNKDGAPDVAVAGGNFSGVTVLLNANGSAVAPNYSLSPSTSSVKLTGGASATLQITTAPQNSFTGTISFGCSGLPSQLSCAFTPQAVQLNGNQQVTVGLTISSAVATAGASRNGGSPQPHPWNRLVALGVFGAFGFALLASGKERKKLAAVSMILSVVSVSFMLTSCGGAPRTTLRNTGMSARTYVVQVDATGVDGNTGRSVSRMLSLNVTVQ